MKAIQLAIPLLAVLNSAAEARGKCTSRMLRATVCGSSDEVSLTKFALHKPPELKPVRKDPRRWPKGQFFHRFRSFKTR